RQREDAMDTEKNRRGDQILARLDRLERAVFGTHSPKQTGAAAKSAGRAALPAHILKLRDSGFFDSPKTAGEVHDRLQAKYRCEIDRVAMALLRLQRRRELRKASKANGGKRQVAYVW